HGVVALFLRLRLAQFSHALRRRPEQLLGMALLLALGIVLTGYAIRLFSEPELLITGDVAAGGVIVGSVVTLGFFVVPFVTASDDASDPRVFGPLGMRPLTVA